MGGISEDYSVKVNRKERVSAVLPLQDHWLPLSNLDLLLPPIDVSVFFCYQHNHHHLITFAAIVSSLQKSLSQALVTYYAFAGEVVINSVGEPELLCNNRGVDFIEAYADVELGELHLYDPDISVGRKLVPKKKDGVFCVQVTELKCGGVVLGCTFDHRIADAYSANMFFVAWAETARLKPISLFPSFRRSLLSPRRPGCHEASLDELYVPLSSLPPPPNNPNPTVDQAVNRIYYVTAEDIDRIQSLASSGVNRRSKLEAFTAYLWRIIGKGAALDAKVCRMGLVVDGRSRLRGEDGTGTPPSMANYFGNVLSIPYATIGFKELEMMETSEVADVVHECVRGAATEEHFLGLIDWVEAHRPEPAVARIYIEGAGGDGPAVVVSSGQRFPVERVDFGWGRPVFGSYHFPWEGSAGYVMPMPSVGKGGDWVVYMHLVRGQVEALEAEAGEVFRRLTPEYLNLSSKDLE